MKKMSWSVLCLCALLFLRGCGRAAPPKAADGATWSGDWVTLGNVIGVDTPEELTARENSDVLSAKGMYYAAWSAGEAVPYVNEDGTDAQLYDAQVYLLAAGHDSTQKAEERAAEWLNMARNLRLSFTPIHQKRTPIPTARRPSGPTGTTPSAWSCPAGRALKVTRWIP